MDVTSVPSPGRRRPATVPRTRRGWHAPALAGAAAFWLANLALSATPVAAGYRSAMGIAYVPMLLEAAAGGLVLGGAVAFLLAHHPARIPGSRPLTKAVVLGALALAVVTIVVELPAKLGSGVDDPSRWLVVATVFNAIRILALAVTVGVATGDPGPGRSRAPGRTRRESTT